VKRDIEWIEKRDDGGRCRIRVKFPGNGKVKWQFKRSDEERWDYTTPPTPEEWATLEEKMDALYNRRRAAYRDLELVRKLARDART